MFLLKCACFRCSYAILPLFILYFFPFIISIAPVKQLLSHLSYQNHLTTKSLRTNWIVISLSQLILFLLFETIYLKL